MKVLNLKNIFLLTPFQHVHSSLLIQYYAKCKRFLLVNLCQIFFLEMKISKRIKFPAAKIIVFLIGAKWLNKRVYISLETWPCTDGRSRHHNRKMLKTTFLSPTNVSVSFFSKQSNCFIVKLPADTTWNLWISETNLKF